MQTYDDFYTCVAGGQVRIDLYGEMIDNRCVALLTREKAMQFSKELAKHALSLPQGKIIHEHKAQAVAVAVSVSQPIVPNGLVVRLPGTKPAGIQVVHLHKAVPDSQ